LVNIFPPVVFSCHDGNVYRVCADKGSLIWTSKHSGKVTATPQLVGIVQNSKRPGFGNHGVLSIGNGSDLRLTDLDSGRSLLLLDLSEGGETSSAAVEMTFAPAIACSTRIVFGMRDDYVYCYKT
jgi:outer membrane protein assembly factor BamB